MDYEILTVKGYWRDVSKNEYAVNIAIGYWEEINTENIKEDDEIFYYFDLEYEEKPNIEVGDIISDGFVITKIYGKENIND